jgi:hypothetical protein
VSAWFFLKLDRPAPVDFLFKADGVGLRGLHRIFVVGPLVPSTNEGQDLPSAGWRLTGRSEPNPRKRKARAPRPSGTGLGLTSRG